MDHPTQKPVELMRRPILNHTKRGEVVYDPFLGSGTTLIAAEMTERRCYGIELDPKYVDVIVQRWQHFTTWPSHAGGRWPDVRGGQSRADGSRRMNRTLPPRDRGNRAADSGWASRFRGIVPRARRTGAPNCGCLTGEVKRWRGLKRRSICRNSRSSAACSAPTRRSPPSSVSAHGPSSVGARMTKFREIMDDAKAKGRISVRRTLFRLGGQRQRRRRHLPGEEPARLPGRREQRATRELAGGADPDCGQTRSLSTHR